MIKPIAFATLSLLLALSPFAVLCAQESAPADNPALNESLPPTKKASYNAPGIRFALGAGYTYRLGKEMPNTSSFSKKLRHGFNLGADLHYAFASGIGLGVNANFVQSSASASGAKETQSVFYVGPSMLLRADGRKGAFIGEVGVGGLFLKDRISGIHDATSSRGYTLGTEGTLSGSTFGVHVSLGGERKLSATTALGLKASANIGAIKKLKYGSKSLELKDRMSASSLMITAFISFRGR